MYCKHCGAQLDNYAKFCTNCGTSFTPVLGEATGKTKSESRFTKGSTANNVVMEKKLSNKSPFKKIISGIIAVLLIAAAAMIILHSVGVMDKITFDIGQTTFDMDKMYTLTSGGVDGYGVVVMEEDSEAISDWICDELNVDPDVAARYMREYYCYDFAKLIDIYVESYGEEMYEVTKEELGRGISLEKAEQLLEQACLIESLEPMVYPESGLKNGDTVTITYQYDEDEFADAKLKLRNTKMEYTIEGLTDIAAVDLFEALNIELSGFNGYGRLHYELEKSRLQSMGITSDQADAVEYYTLIKVSQQDGLKNGDTVIFTVEVAEERLAQAAVDVKNRRWEYTVSGLEEPELIDPFEGLKITCAGISPYISVALDESDCSNIVQQAVKFSLPNGYARNGAAVTVTAGISAEKAAEYGITLAEETKDFIIEGQPEYATSVEGFDLTYVLKEIDDTFIARSAGYPTIKEQKNIFMYRKPQYEDKKGFYNAYVSHYTVADGKGKEKRIIVIAKNLCLDNGGNLISDIQMFSDYSYSSSYLYDRHVTQNRDMYNVIEIN